MGADVRKGLVDQTNGNQWLNKARVTALGIYRIDVRYRNATHRDRHHMLAGFARLQMHCVIIIVVMMRGGPMMLVCGKAVTVFRMIVTGVLVDVQRGDLAGGRGQDQPEQDSCHQHECM